MSNRLERRAAGLPDEPLSPEDFATFMSDVVACNADNRPQAEIDAIRLMGALLVDLGYAEGVLIYNSFDEWFRDDSTPPTESTQ